MDGARVIISMGFFEAGLPAWGRSSIVRRAGLETVCAALGAGGGRCDVMRCASPT